MNGCLRRSTRLGLEITKPEGDYRRQLSARERRVARFEVLPKYEAESKEEAVSTKNIKDEEQNKTGAKDRGGERNRRAGRTEERRGKEMGCERKNLKGYKIGG